MHISIKRRERKVDPRGAYVPLCPLVRIFMYMLAKNVMAENSLEAIMKQEIIGTKTSDMEKIMCYPNLMKQKGNRNVSKILSQLFIK